MGPTYHVGTTQHGWMSIQMEKPPAFEAISTTRFGLKNTPIPAPLVLIPVNLRLQEHTSKFKYVLYRSFLMVPMINSRKIIFPQLFVIHIVYSRCPLLTATILSCGYRTLILRPRRRRNGTVRLGASGRPRRCPFGGSWKSLEIHHSQGCGTDLMELT